MEENTNVSKAIEEIRGADEEQLRRVIEEHFDAVRTQGMKLGATYISAAVMGAIEKNLKNGFNSSHRDFERAIKRVYEIVSMQLNQQETVQNDLAEPTEEAKDD